MCGILLLPLLQDHKEKPLPFPFVRLPSSALPILFGLFTLPVLLLPSQPARAEDATSSALPQTPPVTGTAVRQVAGYVKKVSGDAWIQTGEQTVKAVPGTPVHAESRIRTSSNARLGLTLRDDTLLSLGPDTTLQVSEFVYAPEQGKLQLALSMLKGTLHYISGVIARLRPEAVSVKTPSGIIGVRGTRFAVRVEE